MIDVPGIEGDESKYAPMVRKLLPKGTNKKPRMPPLALFQASPPFPLRRDPGTATA